MNGQLWQECYCGTEPVCASCEKCKRHCRCSNITHQDNTNGGKDGKNCIQTK